MEFDLENPFFIDPQQSLFDIESDHLPLPNSDLQSDHHFQQQTINFISLYSHKLDQPFVTYLAINYLHRFLASQSLPMEKSWVMKLVAVSCVSIAFKMIKGDFIVEVTGNMWAKSFQENNHLMFDLRTVKRMESVILNTLNWRMRSVTPFAFLKFFLSFFKFETSSSPNVNHNDNDIDNNDDVHDLQLLKDRATDIIIKAQIESKLVDLKPSVIAASTLLCASNKLYPLQFPPFKNSILSCSYVNEDELSKCSDVIQELMMDGYESKLNCKTPINILDLDYSSAEGTHIKRKKEQEEEKKGLKKMKISTFSESPFDLF